MLRSDKHEAADGDAMKKRRRECLNADCRERFFTFESYEEPDFDAERRVAAAAKLNVEAAKILTGKVSGAQ